MTQDCVSCLEHKIAQKAEFLDQTNTFLGKQKEQVS